MAWRRQQRARRVILAIGGVLLALGCGGLATTFEDVSLEDALPSESTEAPAAAVDPSAADPGTGVPAPTDAATGAPTASGTDAATTPTTAAPSATPAASASPAAPAPAATTKAPAATTKAPAAPAPTAPRATSSPGGSRPSTTARPGGTKPAAPKPAPEPAAGGPATVTMTANGGEASVDCRGIRAKFAAKGTLTIPEDKLPMSCLVRIGPSMGVFMVHATGSTRCRPSGGDVVCDPAVVR